MTDDTDPDIEVVRGHTICTCGVHTGGVCVTYAALARLTTRLAAAEKENGRLREALHHGEFYLSAMQRAGLDDKCFACGRDVDKRGHKMSCSLTGVLDDLRSALTQEPE